jgi:hypothetical protein
MSKPFIIGKDIVVEGFDRPLEPTPTIVTQTEAVVLNSPTRKYPAPPQDNPRPAPDPQAYAELVHRIRFPKPQQP